MLINLILRLHEHRQWVNRNLLESVQMLSDSEQKQVFQIGQGSIWNSLLHLYAAEYVWLEALLGDESPVLPGDLSSELPGNQKGEEALQSFSELKQNWVKLDQRWIDYLNELTDDSLEEIVSKRSTSSGKGKVHRTKCYDVLLHVCTHAQYTTAQIVNMLRHVGANPLPDTMLITMARNQMAESTDQGAE